MALISMIFLTALSNVNSEDSISVLLITLNLLNTLSYSNTSIDVGA